MNFNLNKIMGSLNLREKILILAGLVLVAVLLPYKFIYAPAWEKIKSLKGQIESQEAEFKIREMQARVYQAVPVPAKQAEKKVIFFNDFADLLSFIGDQTRRNNIGLVSFNPQAKGGGLDLAPNGVVFSDLIMKGSYRSFFNFFKSLAESNYLIGFEKIDLVNDPGKYPVLSAKVVVAAEYAKN